jgi:HAD superfamily hydrolase (TIGR01509 family)
VRIPGDRTSAGAGDVGGVDGPSFGLVIFDCDGVLVDSEPIAVRVDVQIFRMLGLTITEQEVVERFIGRSDADIKLELERALGRTLADDWEEEYNPLYREAFAAELKPVDGVLEALDAIDIPTCVASSGSHEKMRFTLGITGLYDRFAGRIFSVSEVEHGKPAPDLFLHAAKQMQVQPSRCAVVEDSRWGVEAARAAGMQSFGYAGGLTLEDRLAGPGTIIFKDMRRLPELLREVSA